MFQLTLFKGAYIMSPGYVPGAGHHQAENVPTAVGCPGGDITCMRSVKYTTLMTIGSEVASNYSYQLQPRVDGDIVADTYEAQLYQKDFNFSGLLVIYHERHEENRQSSSFGFGITGKNLALTHALHNETWNAIVNLGLATHGTDQTYYWYNTYSTVPANGLNSSSSSSVNVTRTMQQYLPAFVLTGNPNTLWPDDKIYCPKYGNATNTISFNTTMSIAFDDLANDKSLFWNKALWY
ncbi:uncharacterized protein BO87DRAFT_443387 [Aspergillus neoniger CBS 115656]|uniref:Alpha/beta-hydrolase n=1 Tax=Aspergillus neoniger (strain CBS 115656) TaxID=1448310 RepID=A0A318YWE3_ASPNB|nr:hypothetical protein BO87DRAFT_443387 [Aspergillus neoniger CBS 115656]PYH38876.1 hypothetical protein BO87DRAFT_443387 [Aspergillus neoniger CBS 115656]